MKRLQTRVHADMSRYTENFFLGMSARQTILGIAGVAAVALSYIFLPVPGFVAMALGFPLFIAAFVRPDGLPVEKYLLYWLESVLVRPAERIDEGENELYELLWKGKLCGRKVMTKKELAEMRRPAECDMDPDRDIEETSEAGQARRCREKQESTSAKRLLKPGGKKERRTKRRKRD